MASVFDAEKIDYALEKLGDFINKSGTGFEVPEWANTASKSIIDSLRAFEHKMRAGGCSESMIDNDLGIAIYAVCELQSYVTGERGDIPKNQKAARIYRDFLAAKIEGLRRLEHELDESPS